MNAGHNKNAGFTLVELMVSVTLGLIILAAVSLIFVNSKRAYQVQDRLARVQENGRFAMTFLAQDVRMAGFFGCPPIPTPEELLPPNYSSGPSRKFLSTLSGMIVDGSPLSNIPFPYRMDIPIEGFDGDASPAMTAWAPSGNTAALPAGRLAGTDMVAIRMVDATSQVPLAENMATEFADMKVSDATRFTIGDIVIVSDCEKTSLTQITNIDTSTSPRRLVHDKSGSSSPGNYTTKLAKAYGTELSHNSPYDTRAAKISKYAMRRYYVMNNNSGVPSLFRDTNGGNAEELIEGIEDLQVLYGVDRNKTDGLVQPNQYLRANQMTAEDWGRVIAVRIGVLSRTPTNADVDVDRNTYDVNGKSVTVCPAPPATCNDRNQRRVFVETVRLRNYRPDMSAL